MTCEANIARWAERLRLLEPLSPDELVGRIDDAVKRQEKMLEEWKAKRASIDRTTGTVETVDEPVRKKHDVRQRLLDHVTQRFTDSMVNDAGNAFEELLLVGDEEVLRELLRPIFELSDSWPLRLAAQSLDLPTDQDHNWDELLAAFEAPQEEGIVDEPQSGVANP